jgi:antitoxin component YwqK of YwqJK toxin-antitoxin module
LQKTVNLHHGIVEDTQKLFYPNGNIQEIAYLIDGEKYGNIQMFYGNGKLKYQGKLIDGYQDSCWETYDSITGRITNITMYKTDTIQKIFGRALGSIDSTELTIKSINNNELPFSIDFPVDWKLLYPHNNTLITAFSTVSPKSEILTGMTITKYPLKGATFSQFMDGNIKGLMENHQIVESLSRKKLVIDGKNAEEIAYYGYVGKEPGGLIITSILLGTDSYTINCYAPKKDFPLYINLFREIINTIKFKQG